MNLSFHGAAGTVTGSRHLVRANGASLLVDAGLFQGLKELRLRNWEPPGFDPTSVDCVLLTHAHIDHAGYIPRLVRDGFRGPVHCTPATAELAAILLRDAAHLQEEDAAYANKKRFTRHAPALPLFTLEDAERAIKRLDPVEYGKWLELGRGLHARFVNAGHLLGSAFVEMRVETDGRGAAGAGALTLIFSGDVGRYEAPLHLDPDARPACDLLVTESTYGNRLHDHTPLEAQILDALGDVFQRGGIVLIPAFAIGRAQQLVLLLGELMDRGAIPRVPVDINSPMAEEATAIYLRHLADHNLDDGLGTAEHTPIKPPGVHYHHSVEESKALAEARGPRVIISASGMLTGGRVLHHLIRVLPEPKNLVLFVGYQAPGTRGRSLLDGAERVRLHGQEVDSRARLASIHGLSGHADRDELLRWITAAPAPREVFVVHGEPDASRDFAALLQGRMGSRIHVPAIGDSFEL